MIEDSLEAQVLQRKAWSELAHTIAGSLKHGTSSTSTLHTPEYMGWEFMLDVFQGRDGLFGRERWHTRIRAPYHSVVPIRFRLRPVSWIRAANYISGYLGRNYINTGFKEVDKAVVLQTEHKSDVIEILSDPNIRKSVVDIMPIDLQIDEVLEEGVSAFRERVEEIRFLDKSRISDPKRLKDLLDFLVLLLNRLSDMDMVNPRPKKVYGR